MGWLDRTSTIRQCTEWLQATGMVMARPEGSALAYGGTYKNRGGVEGKGASVVIRGDGEKRKRRMCEWPRLGCFNVVLCLGCIHIHVPRSVGLGQ